MQIKKVNYAKNMKLENSNSTKRRQKRRIIAIAAGGTGGHLFPALVVAKRMLEEGYKVIFFSDKRAMRFLNDDNPIFTFDAFKVVMLESQNAPRWQQFFMILKDMWKCRIIFTERASLCIGFGGLISFPAMLFSILTFRKTIIYDPNSVFGLANRLLAPFVNLILLGFHDTARLNKFYKRKCIFIGGIVRDEIKSLVYNMDNPSVNYRAFFKIEDTINITILGGSQAASVFDKVIPEALAALPNDITNKLFVRHQCKAGNEDIVENRYMAAGIAHEVRPFYHNVAEIMRGSHLLIARSGANTVFEIMALGVPSILIPLPTAADDHQFLNAKALRDVNGAILIEQNGITKEKLATTISHLLKHDFLLAEMSKIAHEQSDLYADMKFRTIINHILGYDDNFDMGEIKLSNARYINNNTGIG